MFYSPPTYEPTMYEDASSLQSAIRLSRVEKWEKVLIPDESFLFVWVKMSVVLTRDDDYVFSNNGSRADVASSSNASRSRANSIKGGATNGTKKEFTRFFAQ